MTIKVKFIAKKSNVRRVWSIVMRMSVCLFAHISRKPHGRTAPNFTWMLSMAVAQSTCNGVVICCVLPVLWMTSRFLHVGPMAREAAIEYEKQQWQRQPALSSFQSYSPVDNDAYLHLRRGRSEATLQTIYSARHDLIELAGRLSRDGRCELTVGLECWDVRGCS